ncbi:MAG TPA: LysM domain-containing protein [Gemmatimonadales bacterium]|jgi:hypothetical protein
MRRTTICRSEPVALVLVCAALGVTAPAAQAQDSTTARPRTHIVATGETLWSLAQQYYGDPLLWPEIYRLNTLVVEDPHWIFPGEELRLVPPDTTQMAVAPQAIAPVTTDTTHTDTSAAPVRAVPVVSGADTSQSAARAMVVPPVVAPPPPPPSTESAPSIFRPKTPEVETHGAAAADRAMYRPVYRGDFYAAGFLTENATLPWGSVLGAAGRSSLRNLTATSSARPFEQVSIQAPAGANYHVGDSLVVAELGREVPEWGRVVRPTGIVQVTAVSGRDVVGQVLTLFARVTDGQVALPLEPFSDMGNRVPLPIENGTRGTIIALRDVHAITPALSEVFVNLGRADGIVPGDMFEVLKESAGAGAAPPQQVGVLRVVHVRDHSATAVVARVINLGIDPGSPVRLIRKMPS